MNIFESTFEKHKKLMLEKQFTPAEYNRVATDAANRMASIDKKLEKNPKNVELLKKKQELEDLGYKCLMLMIYVSPLTSLERIQGRDRSLMPSIILRTWRDVNQNINIYKQEFKDNFILINNDPEGATKTFSPELTAPFFQASKAKGKPKTPEEIAKSKADKEQLNKDIENMVKNLPEFTTMEDAKSKINEFIS